MAGWAAMNLNLNLDLNCAVHPAEAGVEQAACQGAAQPKPGARVTVAVGYIRDVTPIALAPKSNTRAQFPHITCTMAGEGVTSPI